MAKAITPEEILRINELYKEHGTYAAVARITGRSGGTVKKYVVKDFVAAEDIQVIKFDNSLVQEHPDLSEYYAKPGTMCDLKESEKADYDALKAEICM